MGKGGKFECILELLYFKAGAGIFSMFVRVCVGDGCHTMEKGRSLSVSWNSWYRSVEDRSRTAPERE